MSRFGALIPVGPGDAEVERLADTVASLTAYEPVNLAQLVLIDDARERRDLRRALPPLRVPVRVLRTGLHERRRRVNMYSAMTAGTLTGLRELVDPTADFAVKLDTDALVVAPFADRVAAALAADSRVGVLGACQRDPFGERDHSGWGWVLARSPRCVDIRRRPPELVLRRPAHAAIIAGTVTGIRRRRRPIGAHPIGGAYAVAQSALAALEGRGAFDWRPWVGTKLSEDVVVGALAVAAGYDLGDHVDDGDVFGVALPGLPDSPERLLSRGFAIVHSVKGYEGWDEAAVRAFFKQNRPGAARELGGGAAVAPSET